MVDKTIMEYNITLNQEYTWIIIDVHLSTVNRIDFYYNIRNLNYDSYGKIFFLKP